VKILLVNPTKLDEQGKPVKFKKDITPSLALAVLSSLTPASHKVTVINDVIEEIDYSIPYDLVGITAMTSRVERAYQIADRFRSIGVRVVLGGIHATALPDEAKVHADAVIIGEAENIWEQVLDDFEHNRNKEYYQDSALPDMKRLIIPRFDTFNMNIYNRPIGYKLPIMPIYSTRGCPFACDFCSVSKYFGRTYRVKPIANILKEIDAIGAEHFMFVDDNIAGNAEYSRELFRALIPKKIKWNSQVSTTIMNHPDLIDLAAESGCRLLFFGLESLNNDILQSLNKGFNKLAQYAELFERLKRAKIVPLISMIFGFDTDTIEQFNYTLSFLLKNKIDTSFFFILTPLPGTTLYSKLEEEGRIISRDWSAYDGQHIVFQPKNFTIEELYHNYWRVFRQFYSVRNITARSFNRIRQSNTPLKTFYYSTINELFYRNKVYRYEHPISGGFGKIKT